MRRATLLLAALLLPAAAHAQLPDPATRALGMGGAYTSIARGYEAVRWNPALLAARGRPGLTIGLPHVLVEAGSNTYGFGDFRRYADATLSDQDKQDLLDRITQDDSVLTIRTITGISPFGLSIGPFGFSIGTAGDADFSLGRDAVELALFGNAGRTGPGEFFTAAGSRARGWAATTIAGSFATAFDIPLGRLSVGATYKRVIGHFIGRASETASQFQVNPQFQVNAAGHAIYTGYSDAFDVSGPGDLLGGEANAGSGFGVDVGGVLQLGGRTLTLSAVLVNVLGSMDWDADRLRYERVLYAVQQNPDGSVTDTESRTTLTTPQAVEGDATARALRDQLLANSDFSRYVRGAASLRLAGFTLSGDLLVRITEGLDAVPSRQIAAGAEYRLLGVIPLRAGFATDFSNSLMLSAGTGLHLLGINIDASIANVEGDARPGVIVGVGVGLFW
jgi:hypothetical protein